ncbi:phosphopantetheine-binding protein [Nocardia sp. NBC_01377]|uniref:acyl carrier protein n=1 Tax=Nocardia sp. NBC_01377 TaxID=2903595 RepID=UPI00324792D6
MTQSLTEQTTEIANVLREELARLLECRPEQVDLGLRLTELPGVDSMRLVQTVVACEKHWNIVLDEDELVEVRTGEDLRDLIAHTVATASASA